VGCNTVILFAVFVNTLPKSMYKDSKGPVILSTDQTGGSEVGGGVERI